MQFNWNITESLDSEIAGECGGEVDLTTMETVQVESWKISGTESTTSGTAIYGGVVSKKTVLSRKTLKDNQQTRWTTQNVLVWVFAIGLLVVVVGGVANDKLSLHDYLDSVSMYASKLIGSNNATHENITKSVVSQKKRKHYKKHGLQGASKRNEQQGQPNGSDCQ